MEPSLTPGSVWALWHAMRDKGPLVQCITNLVRCGPARAGLPAACGGAPLNPVPTRPAPLLQVSMQQLANIQQRLVNEVCILHTRVVRGPMKYGCQPHACMGTTLPQHGPHGQHAAGCRRLPSHGARPRRGAAPLPPPADGRMHQLRARTRISNAALPSSLPIMRELRTPTKGSTATSLTRHHAP
jgi:hypothetical protein